MCAAAIFQAKIPKVIVGLMRSDLPNLMRPRKISMSDLAQDSGYEIDISSGIMKEKILEEFSSVVKNN